MAEAGEGALGEMGTTIAASQATLQSGSTTTKHDIGGNADGVVNAEELAELIKKRQGETSIGTQPDRDSGKLTQETTQDAQKQRHDASVTGSSATAQTGGQQTTGMPLEDQQRVIHVLVVGSIEEAQLLLSVGGIVGGIDIEQDFAALPNLLSAEADEGIEAAIVSADELTGRGRVFPATKSGLRTQRLAQRLIGEQLEDRIMAETIGIIGVFVAGHDLVQPLPQQRQAAVPNAAALPGIAEVLSQFLRQSMALIEGTQGQKSGIAGDLPTGKIGQDRLMTVEGEVQL
jgi:hypothetical protein